MINDDVFGGFGEKCVKVIGMLHDGINRFKVKRGICVAAHY
jgi:hypothetical protein